jgi:putative transposase
MLRRQGLRVNRKKIQAIMRREGLLIPVLRPHPKPEGLSFHVTAPDQLWQTDLTKFWAGPADGWCYLTAVIDCSTREVLGYAVTRRCRTADVLQALHVAVERRFPGESDVRRAELRLRRDHGSQFSSRRYRFALETLGIAGELTYYRHPDGNAFIERFFGTLKDEEIWCRDYPNFETAKEAIVSFIEGYNANRPHSALGYKTPAEVRAEWDSLKTEVA